MHHTFHSTPAWSFRNKHQTITSYNDVKDIPGPFHYKINTLHDSKNVHNPAWQFIYIIRLGKEKRAKDQIKQSPGPALYKPIKNSTNDIKYSIGNKNKQYVKPSPGPHDYSPQLIKTKKKQPSFSMKGRTPSIGQINKKLLTTTAPGGYQSKPIMHSTMGKMGKSVRKDLTQTQKTPAPNSYLTSEVLQRSKSVDNSSRNAAKCVFGSQSRQKDKKKQGPGRKYIQSAFQYAKKSLFQQNQKKKKGYSMRYKTPDLIHQSIGKNPAPVDQYYLIISQLNLSDKKKNPICVFGSENRKTFIDSTQKNTFGPSATKYSANDDPKHKTISFSKFGTSTRRPLDQNEKTPGPVQYPYQNSINSKHKSAPKYGNSRAQSKNGRINGDVGKQLKPGPGYHDPKIQLTKNRNSIGFIGSQRRPDFEHAKKYPGPGFYNLRGKQSGPNWKQAVCNRFGTNTGRDCYAQVINGGKNSKTIKTPGPGSYQVKSKVIDVPKYISVSTFIGASNSNMKQTV